MNNRDLKAALPVTLLTGFLGSGKTTLLNRILAHPAAGRVAVVMNERGAVDIDSRLVIGAEDRLVSLSDGCVCCVVREDLARGVGELLRARTRWFRPLQFDRILIETSGLAAPGPVVQTFLLDPTLAAATRVDGVITVVHAGHLARQLLAHPEVRAQLAGADAVVLSHLDATADPGEAEALARANAPLARVLPSPTEIPPLLDLRTDDPGRWSLVPLVHTTGTESLILHAPGPVELDRLKVFLQYLASRKTWEIWRIKGILRTTDTPRPVVVQAVYQVLQLGPAPEGVLSPDALVLLGRGLDAAEIRRAWGQATGAPAADRSD